MIRTEKQLSELKIKINRGNSHRGKKSGRGHLWVRVEVGGEVWLLTPGEAMQIADGLVDAAEALLMREDGGKQPPLAVDEGAADL